MSYFGKSDVRSHLSAQTVQPLSTAQVRIDTKSLPEEMSHEVKADIPDTEGVTPFHPIAKGVSSQAQVGGKVGVPSGASRPKRSRL